MAALEEVSHGVWRVGPDQEVNEAAAKLETIANLVFDSHYSHPVY